MSEFKFLDRTFFILKLIKDKHISFILLVSLERRESLRGLSTQYSLSIHRALFRAVAIDFNETNNVTTNNSYYLLLLSKAFF